ncbi:MAG: CBS domain-containing protein [Clostridium sp.]|nr:CBS domain-containing protein [Clostridium sp.]
MNEVNHLTIDKNKNIRDAMKKIDKESSQIVFVIDEEEHLLGTITDGDIRRWILKNGSMDELVVKVMNKHPTILYEQEKNKAYKVMKDKSIKAIPILDDDNKIIDVVFLYSYRNRKSKNLKDTPIVIMAGGLGTRLYPYTKILPKPLIPIGDTPILERIITKFNDYGAIDFYLTVNYKKNMIKSYFNELTERNYHINYVEEKIALGTGGSLSLLKDKIDKTFFVSNCDILVEADYQDILKYHKRSHNKVTVVTSMKNYTIPYGVFDLNEKGKIVDVKEKPECSYLINIGMYVLEPDVIDDIPYGKYFDLPSIIENYVKDEINVGVYPISENSWMDMGQISEMKQMIKFIEEKENYSE